MHGINYRHPVSGGIHHMIADHKRPPIDIYLPVEIMQDEKAAEIKPRIPKRIRNPTIQIIIRQGRRIVGNCRRAIIVVIVVDNLGVRIREVIICLRLHIFVGRPLRRRRLDCFPFHLDLIAVFLGDGFIAVGEMENPLLIDIFINDGTGRISTRPSLHGRWRGGLRSDRQTKSGL
jgi:hypothetical protein